MARTSCLVMLALAVMAFAGAGVAADDDSPERAQALEDRLSSATSLDCSFSDVASGRWNSGKPTTLLKPAQLKISFTKINADEGTAEAGSNYGPSYIVVKYAGSYLHLIQQLRDGQLYTTSVLAHTTADGRFMAVHTRIEYTTASVPGFTSEPEMYFGSCSVGTAKAGPVSSAAPDRR